jgi:hypothetical protein
MGFVRLFPTSLSSNLHKSNTFFMKKKYDNNIKKKTPWPESTSELYRPSDIRLPAKLFPTFEDSGAWSPWPIPTAVFSDF